MSDDFTLSGITPFNGSLDQGTALIITNPTQIPHISICTGGRVFSLSVNGLSVKPVAQVLAGLQRKKIQTLLIEIKELVLPDFAEKIFTDFVTVSTSVTCLFPVRDCLVDEPNRNKVDLIYKLLHFLHSKDQLVKAQSMNMDELVHNGCFTFRSYSAEEVRRSIASLLNKETHA